MTLDTRILIEQPTDIEAVFAFVNNLIGGGPQNRDKERENGFGNRTIANKPDQGLPGWLMIDYGADGPLIGRCSQWHDCKVEDDDHWCRPPGAIEISIDTAYGYRDWNQAHGLPDHGSASDLHAWIIRETGRWLDTQGLTWLWKDEFQGTWHRGDDHHLAEFGDADLGALIEVAS